MTDSERLAKVETIVEVIHDRLFGNGQPGELSKLDDRVQVLENNKNRIIGAFSIVSVLMTFLGWVHIKEFFVHK